jgi:trehalose synthase
MSARVNHHAEVHTDRISPDRFREILDPEDWTSFAAAVEQARRLFEGRVIWNVNSTAAGGGVAEMLRSLMAYARGAGLDARWVAVPGTPPFFNLTKRLHNWIHGDPGDGGPLGEAERRVYEEVTGQNAAWLADYVEPQDVVILHDPQTVGMARRLKDTGALIVWRSHIGTEQPNDLVLQAWHFILPYVFSADAQVFSRYLYVPTELRAGRTMVITPSIDPFSPKNQELEPGVVRAILRKVGLVAGEVPEDAAPTFHRHDRTVRHVERACEQVTEGHLPDFSTPLVVQVSRWDRLKDPEGVMRGFAEHVADHSDAHLILAGPSVNSVTDDPEGVVVLAETTAAWQSLPAGERRRVHLACLPMDDLEENAAIVNALQRHATVVVQKSLHEGFGLTVTEAMWKRRPVVASNLGGIRKQIEDGRTGVLLSDPRDLCRFGEALRGLLTNPARASELGERAHEYVRHHSLHSQHLVRWVRLLADLSSGGRFR